MHGCIVIVLAVHIHIHIYIYMTYDKTRILLNPFVGLLLGCKSSYTCGTWRSSGERRAYREFCDNVIISCIFSSFNFRISKYNKVPSAPQF